MSQDEKEKSHARIVASASRLMRERGLAGTSVDDVMQAAGMSHGGFYKHFTSKDALAEAAVGAAFAQFIALLDQGDPQVAVDTYRSQYLSDDHLSHPGLGCPVATLAQEVARSPQASKANFGLAVRTLIGRLARVGKGSIQNREAAAYREFSMIVGAVVIARASDAATAAEVLDAVRRKSGHA